MEKFSNVKKGAIFLVFSALGFAVMSIFVKLAGDAIPATQKVVFRNVISMGLAFYMVKRNGLSFLGKQEHRKYLLLRSLFGTIGMVLFFYSIDNLVVSDANMLNKLSTFFLILFSAIFLKEHVKRYQILGVVVAFLGTLLIIKPAFNIELLPYLTSISAAMFAGAAYTMLRVLGTKESTYTVVFFFSSFSIIMLAPIVAFTYVPMTLLESLYLLLAGVFATLGQFGITLAYKYAAARDISIFNYFNVLFAGILGWFVFSEAPDWISMLGYVLIFSAAYYIFYRNKRHAE
jgi:drug/metabolite transporter (DMT)-like permease